MATTTDLTNQKINYGVWCGKVVQEPVFNHEVRNKQTDELIQSYYLLKIEVDYKDHKGLIHDVSELPVQVSKTHLEKAGEVKVGDILFVKGEYRAYDRSNDENASSKIVTRIAANKVEVVEDYISNVNKIEFVGLLNSKLYKSKFTEDGKIELDFKKRPVPVLDEEGNKIPWLKKENGHMINDIRIEVSKHSVDYTGTLRKTYTDFIPAIAYDATAIKISRDIKVNTPVKASGYVRRRPKKGVPGEYVFEPVITHIEAIQPQ